MTINTYLSTTTLKVKGLNASIKRHVVAKWITKPSIYVIYKRLTSTLKTHTD